MPMIGSEPQVGPGDGTTGRPAEDREATENRDADSGIWGRLEACKTSSELIQYFKSTLEGFLKDNMSYHRYIRDITGPGNDQSDRFWMAIVGKLFYEGLAVDQQVFSSFEEFFTYLSTKLPSSRFFISKLYNFLSNEFSQTPKHLKDQILLVAMKTLRVLYFFGQNRQLTPNSYIVLADKTASIKGTYSSPDNQDLSDGFSIALSFQREGSEEFLEGHENIFSLTNKFGWGYSLKYDRRTGCLIFVVREEGTNHSHSICQMNSHFWNSVIVTQSFTKWRKILKINFSLNGANSNFELKISKLPALTDYTLLVGGDFVGYIGTIMLSKKTFESSVLQRFNNHVNLGVASRQGLMDLESIIVSKRTKKGLPGDFVTVISPLAATLKDTQEVILEILDSSKMIYMFGGAFTWFKTSEKYDIGLYGGFDPFIMNLTFINNSEQLAIFLEIFYFFIVKTPENQALMLEQGTVKSLVGFLEKYPSLMDDNAQRIFTDMLIDLDNKAMLKQFLKYFFLNIDLIAQTSSDFKEYICQTATLLYRKRAWLAEIFPLDWIVKSLILYFYSLENKVHGETEKDSPGKSPSKAYPSRAYKPRKIIEVSPTNVAKILPPQFTEDIQPQEITDLKSIDIAAADKRSSEDSLESVGIVEMPAEVTDNSKAISEEFSEVDSFYVLSHEGVLANPIQRLESETLGISPILTSRTFPLANQLLESTIISDDPSQIRLFKKPSDQSSTIKVESSDLGLGNDRLSDYTEGDLSKVKEGTNLSEISQNDPPEVLEKIENIDNDESSINEAECNKAVFMNADIDYLIQLVENILSDPATQKEHLQKNTNFIFSSLCFPNLPYTLQRYLLRLCRIIVNQLLTLPVAISKALIANSNMVFSLIDLFKNSKCYRTKTDVLKLVEDLNSITNIGRKRVLDFLSIFSSSKILTASEYPGTDIEADLSSLFNQVFESISENSRLSSEKLSGSDLYAPDDRRGVNAGLVDCLINIFSHLNYSLKMIIMTNLHTTISEKSCPELYSHCNFQRWGFHNLVKLSVLLTEYDSCEHGINAFLEEESVDDQLVENKLKKKDGSESRKRNSSFYLKTVSKEELTTLIDSFYLVFSTYYSYMVLDHGSKDVLDKINAYSDLIMESPDLNYMGIDAKILDKKVKVSNLRFVNETYTYLVSTVRSKLLRETLRKLVSLEKEDGQLRANDSFKAFFMKCTLYAFSGLSVEVLSSKQQKEQETNEPATPLLVSQGDARENREKSIPSELDKDMLVSGNDASQDTKVSEQPQYERPILEDLSKDSPTLGPVKSTEHPVVLRKRNPSVSKFKDDPNYYRIGRSEYFCVDRYSKSGAWADEDLFERIIFATLKLFQLVTIEQFVIDFTSHNSYPVSKDLLYSVSINKDCKPSLYILIFDIIRIGIQYFGRAKKYEELQRALSCAEKLFFNLLAFNEIFRRSLLGDKVKALDGLLIKLLYDIRLNDFPEESRERQMIIACSDNLMKILFRAFMTKIDFKVSKSTNLEFILSNIDMGSMTPMFSFTVDFLDKKFKLLDDFSEEHPQAEETDEEHLAVIQRKVSRLYSEHDILNKLGLFFNQSIAKVYEDSLRHCNFAHNEDNYRTLKIRITESMVELAFKIDAINRAIELDINHHEERYEAILHYLKTTIEISGISSESVMRACRHAAYKLSKLQRDVNGYWADNELQSALQDNRIFEAGNFDYDLFQRNRFYDFTVEGFLTGQKTKPFIKFDLRRYWNDNYDDILNDEEQDGAKSIFFSLETRQKAKQKRQQQITNFQTKKTGFMFFQSKKHLHKGKLKHRLLQASETEVESSKLYTEDLGSENVLFGKRCQMVDKFMIRRGSLYIIQDRLIFYINTFEVTNYFSNHKKEIKNFDKLKRSWPVRSIRDIKVRRMNQRKTAIEIFFKDGYSVYFNFNRSEPVSKDLMEFYNMLKTVISVNNPKSDFSRLFNFNLVKQFESMKLTDRWLAGDISNFEYLMEVNLFAGRSYMDLSQYPVFPWVMMIDYLMDDKGLDFKTADTESFLGQFKMRDLSKTIGALGDKVRLQNYIKRFSNANYFDQHVPPYYYGSHYSTPAVVIYFLIRLYPFTEGAIDFQSGVFDIADRLFHSINNCFKNAMEEMSDVRELIPEFFFMPEFLVNINKLNLGHLHTNERVNSVDLPAWCRGNPYVFCYVLRKLLESDSVSQGLNGWIDLIFGYKQTGEEAISNYNVFYYLTYEGAVDMDALPEEDKDAIETQVLHFGQTPSKLFSKPHLKMAETCPRFINGINHDKDRMMLYTRKLKDNPGTSSNVIRGIYASGPSNPKTVLACVKGNSIELYQWEPKSFKELNEKNNIPFKLTLLQEFSMADFKTNDTFDFTDRGLYGEYEQPLAYLLDKKIIILGGYISGVLRTYNVGKKKLKDLPAHGSTVTKLAFNKNQTFLASSSSDGLLLLWKVEEGELGLPPTRFYEFSCKILDIYMSRDNSNLMAVSGENGKVILYNMINKNIMRTLVHPHQYPIDRVLLSLYPLACLLFYSHKDYMIYSFSINGQLLATHKPPKTKITDAEVGTDGDFCDFLVVFS